MTIEQVQKVETLRSLRYPEGHRVVELSLGKDKLWQVAVVRDIDVVNRVLILAPTMQEARRIAGELQQGDEMIVKKARVHESVGLAEISRI